MKKFYFLFFTFLISSISFSQVIITELADPNNNAGARYVEIYNVGSTGFDLTGWELRRWTNEQVDPQTSGVDLSSIGTLSAGSFAIIAANGTEFQNVYGFAPDISAGTGGAADSNGDDQIAIFDAADATIDIFGVPGEDGTGTCHEFEDGRAERIATVSVPNATFNEAEWNVWADSPITGCTSHTNAAQDAPGIFDPGAWIGESNACGVSLGAVSYVCQTNTAGADNDFVQIEISYSGSDAGITSVTSSDQGASISGDDPATVPDGTIIISGQGVQEGYAWDVILNGGDCDGNSTSGTVPSTECDPARNTCFDLSGGAELFELVTVASNSDGDTWTFDTGTYEMNGFCGTSCSEASDTWLIFGPLDMTGVSDLALLFDAVESFDGTDLNIQYTSDYSSGCPSSSTWTSAQPPIGGDGTGTGNYTVDLSAAMGTDVFVGIQYLDSDGFPNSGWALSNVELASFGTCPTLGTRPTSDCAVCDVSLGTENYVCLTNTAGDNNDNVTIEIPYTGSESTITSITTTSGGTVGGDDPTSVADGTITITGLSEGSAWDLTINGGDCDGTTISGTIPASLCDPVSCPNPGDLIISEIMQNPSAVSDGNGEYFEVYNSTAAPIDMQGFVIKDDATASEQFTVVGSLIVPGNGYIVFGLNADSLTNGGLTVDYEYTSISLGNGSDGLIIECSSTLIDTVVWDDGATFPDPNGASMELSSSFLARLDNPDNNTGSNWGVATTPYGDGDLGTPGAANDFLLSNELFQANNVKVYPNPTNLGYVNISVVDSGAINARVFDILGKEVLNGTVENNQLNISNLNSGMYIMKLSQNNATITKKLVIK